MRPQRDVMTRAQKVGRHAVTHDAESQETELCQEWILRDEALKYRF
jgi:hypothetical protein